MLSRIESDAEHALCVRQLRELFGDLAPEVIDGILAVASTRSLESGQTLFAQGDPAGPLYIVLSGRLRAVVARPGAKDAAGDFIEPAAETVVLGDIAAGEPVGEMALFTGEARLASVIALRPSRLLCLTEANYLQLISRHPELVLPLNRFLVHRLRQNSLPARSRALPRNVAVIDACRSTDLRRWMDSAARALHALGVEAHLVSPPAQGTDIGAILDAETVEHHGGMNLLLCHAAADEWTRGCLTCADLIVLAVDFGADPAVQPSERELGLHADGLLSTRLLLLLLHPPGVTVPSGTARWLANRRVALHVHVRTDQARDCRRFCRLLANRAVGVVLGGGGARGYGHLGAVRALLEDGLEIDFLGGTSAGALYGAGMSLFDFDWERLAGYGPIGNRIAPTRLDYTLPLLSLKSGRKMRLFLRQVFGDLHLEDLWTNCFCVSSNYSTASPAVHERGLARQCIEASIAIPGIFPPVLIRRQLHVDGGLFDNLPIHAMLAHPVRQVVAISLLAQSPTEHDLLELPTTWELFRDRVRRRRQFDLPSLPALLVNAMVLNSEHQRALSVTRAALYLELDLRGVGMLDWARWQEASQAGYEQTRQRLSAMPKEQKFWLNPGGNR